MGNKTLIRGGDVMNYQNKNFQDCPACERQIGNPCIQCPHCGLSVNWHHNKKILKKLFFVLLALYGIAVIFTATFGIDLFP